MQDVLGLRVKVRSKVHSPKSESPKSQPGSWRSWRWGRTWATAGGNVLRGDERLEELSDGPLLRSSLWQTTPVDCPPGSPAFVNAVVGLMPRAGETPESLLAKLQALEKEFGRQPKKVLNEPRPLDLDLIAFGSETRATPELTLPHPRAHQRRFVLQPLSEIAPDLVLPGQSESVAQLLAQLPPDESMRKARRSRAMRATDKLPEKPALATAGSPWAEGGSALCCDRGCWLRRRLRLRRRAEEQGQRERRPGSPRPTAPGTGSRKLVRLSWVKTAASGKGRPNLPPARQRPGSPR